jgi:hypothetical protein
METREKLKKMLTEWSEFDPPELYRRDFNYSLLESGEVLSIIGARRAGKTYLCYQIINELKKKYPPENIAYINMEDERLHPINGDELTLLLEVYEELFSVDRSKKFFLVIDEIQNVNNWSKWARRITEQNKNLKLIITGSSSKLLSSEIATELRGRTTSFAVYPLSFAEYLGAVNFKTENKNILYSNERVIIKKQFNNYLKAGGFPATLRGGEPKEILKEYFRVMFYRDLIERYKIKNIRLFEDYLTLLIDQIASSFSISSTANKLMTFGYSFSKNTLSNFSKYAEDAFLVFEVRKYSHKLKEQLRAPKKIYAIDHGLVQAVRFSFSEDYGRLLENIVFTALKRRGVGIFYHQGKKECDFLVSEGGRVSQAIQVTKSMANAETKKREVDGLFEAMEFHKLKEGLILTEDENDKIKIGKSSIEILPIWYWLIN